MQYDQDDYLTCMELLLPVLKDEGVQKRTAESDEKLLIFDLLIYHRYRLTNIKSLPPPPAPPVKKSSTISAQDDQVEDEDAPNPEETIEETIGELTGHVTTLITINADSTSFWAYPTADSVINDSDITDLIQVLTTSLQPSSFKGIPQYERHAAVLMLGNIAMSDMTAGALGSIAGLTNGIVTILSRTGGDEDVELLHSTLGLARNLVVQKDNKTRLADAGIFKGLDKLLVHNRVEVKVAAQKLLGGLLRDSLQNSQFFLSTDGQSLRDALSKISESEKDNGLVQTETGRIWVAVLRTLALHPVSEPSTSPDAANPLPPIDGAALSAVFGLARHPNPRLKTEAWLGLALASKYPPGADAVVKLAKEEKDFETLLTKTLEGKTDKEGEGEAVMAAKDAENGLVLLNHVLTNASDLDRDLREKCKELLGKYTGGLGVPNE
jgi:hypothetical protein